MKDNAVALRQFLTFTVAGEEYAIEVHRVREILAFTPLTKVPRAPRFIAGVMNLRGTVVPVVDLRVKLGMTATATTQQTCIIIVDVSLENGATTMGVLAEDVKRVMDLAGEDIEAPPSFGTKIDLGFLIGMGDLGDHFALILNIDKVLSEVELIAAVSAAAGIAEGGGESPIDRGNPSAKRRRSERAG
jgi:purine-binding chemotaxis protein CheW